jgi:hypothetical protein
VYPIGWQSKQTIEEEEEEEEEITSLHCPALPCPALPKQTKFAIPARSRSPHNLTAVKL